MFMFFFLQELLFSPKYIAMHGNMTKDCQYMSADGGSIECDCGEYAFLKRMFSLPLGSFPDHVVAHFTIGVDPKYGNDDSIETSFFAVLSDGNSSAGYFISDRERYGYNQPCILVRGIPNGFNFLNFKQIVSKNNPYPSTYDIIISTKQKSAACKTAFSIEGSFTTSGYFDVDFEVGNQLTLDIYQVEFNGVTKYNFRYIVVDIHPGL